MIRVLDKYIADKIAAGEVIERPVSAVKELVENSIDAGANSIIVEIRNGGKSYIRVTDDGCGIAPDEAETAFLRHATSKISSISDLDNIRSLGFRGEALASITAVSRLTMVTRTHDRTAGVRLVMHGGKVISNETAGANPGTTIVAEDLFYNTPARRKFMGSDAREGSAVIELIQQYAVCYPEIRFMMIRNGETVFSTAGDGDTLHTIQTLYPDTEHAGLIHISGNNVSGYISDPGTTRSTRRGQLFFVNGRLVDSKIIEKGLLDGYDGRIFSGHPIAILFIDADPSEIDVNIHPGKREIRFLKESNIISDISSAVSSAMQTREAVPAGITARDISADADVPKASESHIYRSEAVEKNNPAQYSEIKEDLPLKGDQSSLREFLGNLKRPGEPTREIPSSEEEVSEVNADERTTTGWRPHEEHIPAGEKFSFDDLKYRGYLFDTFIMMQSADTVYLFDQHAAHERIFYERFAGNYINGKKYTQPILTPVTINVSADVYYMSREWLEPLIQAGYEIEDFGKDTFVIRAIPSYMELSEAEAFARSYLENIKGETVRNNTVIDKLIMKSCKSAVKANEKLSEHEITQLIRTLAACSNPYCCPHGRPTFIRYTRYEIEKSFRRK